MQLRQYITFQKVSLKDAYRHHFKATFQLFVPTIAISVYTMLDQTMLGYLYSEEHVTYYKDAMGFVKMFLYFITSIGTVVMPRVTNEFYNSGNGAEKAQALINTTMADGKTALTEANDAEDDAYDAYNKAFKEVNSYLTEADNKAAALVTATDALNGKNAACVAAGLGSQCANEITTASPCGTSTLSKTAQEYCDAESAYESAQSDSVTAQKASSDVQSSVNYTTLEKAYSEAKATAEKAQTTYDDAAKKFNTVNANYFEASSGSVGRNESLIWQQGRDI